MANKLIIVGVKTRERMEMQYYPKKLNISRDANIAEQYVIGRNNPFSHYTSGQTTLSLDLSFHAEAEDKEDVMTTCKWLESKGYNESRLISPENLVIVFGRMFRGEMWSLRKCSIDYDLFSPEEGNLPMVAKASLVFKLDPIDDIIQSQVQW